MVLALAGAVVLFGTAAPVASARWVRVNPGNFNAYQWVEKDGTATPRYLTEDHFNNKVRQEAARAVQNGATGQAASSVGANGAQATAAQKTRTALAQRAAGGANAATQKLLNQASQAARKVGTMPKFSALGSIVLPTVAFNVGWKIGEGIGAKYLGIEAPAHGQLSGINNTTYTNPVAVATDGGRCAVTSGGGAGDQACTGAATEYELPDEDGLLFEVTSPAAGTMRQTLVESSAPYACWNTVRAPRDALPAGDTIKQRTPSTGNCLGSPSGYTGTNAIVWAPAETTGIEDYDGQPVTKTTAAPASVTENNAVTNATTVLTSPEYDEYNEFNLANDGEDDGAAEVTQTVPNCAGLTAPDCLLALAAAGFENITIQQLSDEEAELTMPASAVLVMDPEAGSQALPGAEITLTVNPDVMPLVVPLPEDGETGAAYQNRAQAAGLTVTVVELTDTTLSPDHGPNEVTNVAPAPGTRVAPGTDITIRVNPATAPAPATGSAGGGCDRPPIRPFDLGGIAPIADQFPFGIPFFIVAFLQGLVSEGGAPVLHIELPGIGTLHYDLAPLDGAWEIAHPVLIVCAAIGMLLSLANLFGRFWIDREIRERVT